MMENAPKLITQEDNDTISMDPTEDEVKNIVGNMNGDSAYDLDDFLRLFYQNCRPVIGEDVTMVVQTFFCGKCCQDL